MTDSSLSWSQITQWRNECYTRFGSIHKIPVIDREEITNQWAMRSKEILDIGAGIQKQLKALLSQPDQRYYALDNDPAGDFDFSNFEDVPPNKTFDLMVANQVLEHLSIDSTIKLLNQAYKHLEHGGAIIVTVPNVAHPVRYWGDVTHVTPWPLFDLYSVMRGAEFEILAIYRYNKAPLPRNFLKRMIVDTVCDVFRIDWCISLMIIGQKNNGTG